MFTFLLFNTVRDLNDSSLPYFLKFDLNYIIERDSFLLFLQNIIITIITSYGQFVKTRVSLCINNLYWRFSHISLHRFIINSLLWINKREEFHFCMCFNWSIIMYFSSLTSLSCLFSEITVVRFLLNIFPPLWYHEQESRFSSR